MKGDYIVNIIKSTIVTVVLFIIELKSKGIITRLIILPFLFTQIFLIGKNVCLLKENVQGANIFKRLSVLSFIIFWFGFLAFWSHLTIKEKNYFPLLFVIPFCIVGIYFIRKNLLGIDTQNQLENKNSKFNFRIIIGCILLATVFLSGIIILFIGIKDTYKLNKITQKYSITEGYFKYYEIYSTSKKGKKTYKLFYYYIIDDEVYTVSTDYGVGRIPEKNSIRQVKYNPKNPNEAILVGTNSSNFLIYFGVFFTLGGTTFIIVVLNSKGLFNKAKIDIMGTYFGVVITIIGIGILLFQNGATLSFKETIKFFGIWIFIPISFIVIGTIQTAKSSFLRDKDTNV